MGGLAGKVEQAEHLQPTLRVSNIGRSLAQGGLSALIMRVGGMGLLFVLQIVLTRSLGLNNYGEFAYALSWANILAFVATLGMDRAALRYVAQYRTTSEHSLLRGFLRRAAQVSGAGSVVLSLGMAGAVLIFRSHFSESQFFSLLTASLIIPIIAQSAICDAALLAMERVSQGLTSSILRPAVVIVLILGATHFWGASREAAPALLCYLVGSVACWLIGLFFIRKWLSEKEIAPSHNYQTRHWVTVAVPLMLVVLLNFMQNQSGVILSGTFLGAEQAGLFSAASRISEAVLFGFHSINAVAAPTFAAMYAKGDQSELRRFVWLCAWGSTLVTTLAVVPLLIFGRPLMKLFGPEFVAAYPTLLVLLLNPVIMSVAGSVNYLLNMTGHQDLCLKVFAVTTVIYLLLCFFLIPLWGNVGIAISNVLTTAAWNGVLLYYVRQRLGIRSYIGKM